MTVIRIKGFQIFKDRHGLQRCYHRATRIAVDLTKCPMGSAAFFSECERIAAMQRIAPEPKPGTFGLLVKSYKASEQYRQLAPLTAKEYEKFLQYLKPINAIILADFNPPMVVKIRDKALVNHSWDFANRVKKVISVVFSWGYERGYIASNPAADIRKLSRPKDMLRANRPWSDAERYIVLDNAPERLKLPLAIMMYTGIDRVDVVKLLKAQYVDGVFILSRSKTSEPVVVAAPAVLSGIIAQAPENNSVFICTNSYGQAWTVDGLSTEWQKYRGKLLEAGLVGHGLTLKGLRHSKATMLREMDYSKGEIADSLGQKTESMAGWYSRDADLREKALEMATALDVEEAARRAKFTGATVVNFVKPLAKTVKPKISGKS